MNEQVNGKNIQINISEDIIVRIGARPHWIRTDLHLVSWW
jgi:hypothetical protein